MNGEFDKRREAEKERVKGQMVSLEVSLFTRYILDTVMFLVVQRFKEKAQEGLAGWDDRVFVNGGHIDKTLYNDDIQKIVSGGSTDELDYVDAIIKLAILWFHRAKEKDEPERSETDAREAEGGEGSPLHATDVRAIFDS